MDLLMKALNQVQLKNSLTVITGFATLIWHGGFASSSNRGNVAEVLPLLVLC